MVLVTIQVGQEEKSMYMDDRLNRELETNVIPKVKKKDNDGVYVIDGEEGSGKSVFAQQLAKRFDSTFNLSRMAFTPDEFVKCILRAKKGQCVIFDEAFTGLSSRGSLSEVNRLLVSLMMEMRQKNLFVIIVMPTYFLLDKYVALWRARGLFHVYTKRGKRGYWMHFNKKQKKLLYLLGKKLYDYSKPRSSFKGRFYDRYTVDEPKYRELKKLAMNKKSRLTRAQVYMEQRNSLFWLLSKEYKLNNTNIARVCGKYGFKIARNTISEILMQKQKDILQEEINVGETEQ